MSFHISLDGLELLIGGLAATFLWWVFNKILPAEYKYLRDRRYQRAQEQREWFNDIESLLIQLMAQGHQILRADSISVEEIQDEIEPISFRLIEVASHPPGGADDNLRAALFRLSGLTLFMSDLLELSESDSFTEYMEGLRSRMMVSDDAEINHAEFASHIEALQPMYERAIQAGAKSDFDVDEESMRKFLEETPDDIIAGKFPDTVAGFFDSIPFGHVDEALPPEAREYAINYITGLALHMTLLEYPNQLLTRVEEQR